MFLLLFCFLPLINPYLLGPWSDRVGRKYPLCLSMFGLFLQCLAYCLFDYFSSVRAEVTMIGSLLSSVTGGSFVLLAASVGYISDITSIESRTLRISVAISFIGVGNFCGSFLSGVIYSKFGYSVLFLVWFWLSCVALLYCLFRIENKIPKRSGYREIDEPSVDRFSCLELFDFRHIVTAFKTVMKRRRGNRRGIVWTLIMIYSFGIAFLVGEYFFSSKAITFKSRPVIYLTFSAF